MEPQTKLLTISEAAKRLGVHVRTLRAWADKGLVPYVKLPSGHRRFDEAEIEKTLDRMYQEGKAAA